MRSHNPRSANVCMFIKTKAKKNTLFLTVAKPHTFFMGNPVVSSGYAIKLAHFQYLPGASSVWRSRAAPSPVSLPGSGPISASAVSLPGSGPGPPTL